MTNPPPGYDDSSVIPYSQLVVLLDRFEVELEKTEQVFRKRVLGEFQMNEDLSQDFWLLRHAAEELGEVPLELANQLMASYENFQLAPTPDALDALIGNVRQLKGYLQEEK